MKKKLLRWWPNLWQCLLAEVGITALRNSVAFGRPGLEMQKWKCFHPKFSWRRKPKSIDLNLEPWTCLQVRWVSIFHRIADYCHHTDTVFFPFSKAYESSPLRLQLAQLARATGRTCRLLVVQGPQHPKCFHLGLVSLSILLLLLLFLFFCFFFFFLLLLLL